MSIPRLPFMLGRFKSLPRHDPRFGVLTPTGDCWRGSIEALLGMRYRSGVFLERSGSVLPA